MFWAFFKHKVNKEEIKEHIKLRSIGKEVGAVHYGGNSTLLFFDCLNEWQALWVYV